eukprot:CAMPEP_0194488966 /NCGR_PEP_ID=MMETSP0253-20130528/8697_1 /TAXON_ID=2966 /ORGANISM="Noctiluca scintillans" /LENGTH=150 /DNA_ID=CAMNT_0039329389 /DNA_START=213 /DNA_END=665 /DNA_ORIENTATION=+
MTHKCQLSDSTRSLSKKSLRALALKRVVVPDNLVPHHRVLTEVRVRKTVVRTVVLGIVQPRNSHLVLHVVGSREQQREHVEDQDREHVTRNHVEDDEMEVFSDNKFYRVNVDRIPVPTTRRDLTVMMLVDVAIDLPQVEHAVPQAVHGII